MPCDIDLSFYSKVAGHWIPRDVRLTLLTNAKGLEFLGEFFVSLRLDFLYYVIMVVVVVVVSH